MCFRLLQIFGFQNPAGASVLHVCVRANFAFVPLMTSHLALRIEPPETTPESVSSALFSPRTTT